MNAIVLTSRPSVDLSDGFDAYDGYSYCEAATIDETEPAWRVYIFDKLTSSFIEGVTDLSAIELAEYLEQWSEPDSIPFPCPQSEPFPFPVGVQLTCFASPQKRTTRKAARRYSGFDRLFALASILKERRLPTTLDELQKNLEERTESVSRRTVRRDLMFLEGQGYLVVTKGKRIGRGQEPDHFTWEPLKGAAFISRSGELERGRPRRQA